MDHVEYAAFSECWGDVVADEVRRMRWAGKSVPGAMRSLGVNPPSGIGSWCCSWGDVARVIAKRSE